VKSVCALLLTLSVLFSQTPAPVQPLPFSHKIHVADVKLDCADCHLIPVKFGDAVGIPDAPRCLECHAWSTKQTGTLNQLNAYVDKKQPIAWVRVFRLKDFVFFDHLYHLQNGAQCEGCHGPVGTEDVVSDQLGMTTMAFCQPCHVKAGAKTGCNTCHDPR
jgi:predicted CXXCH cytochrome family protein